jgi:hypothetical protein
MTPAPGHGLGGLPGHEAIEPIFSFKGQTNPYNTVNRQIDLGRNLGCFHADVRRLAFH